MRLSGAEGVAGYNIYNEKITVSLNNDDADDFERAEGANDTLALPRPINHSVRLTISEVRNFAMYGPMLLKEARARLTNNDGLGLIIILCFDVSSRDSCTALVSNYKI
jgi:hypothetical protein